MEVEHPSWSPVFKFPDEIIVRLLHLCSYQAILRFSKTCRRYRELVVNTASLQLHIELDVSGMEVLGEALSSNKGYSTMLNDIRMYRESWQNLDLETDFQQVQHDISDAMSWVVYNGILVKEVSSDITGGQDSLVIAPLDSASHPNQLCSRSRVNLDAVAVDLSQELLVLVGSDPNNPAGSYGHVDLVSSVTGHSHPAAGLSTFNVILGETASHISLQVVSIAIVGERIFISFGDVRIGRYKIFTWNWRTGSLHHIIWGTGILFGFSLIDQIHLAALVGTGNPRVRNLHLQIYATPPMHTAPNHSLSQNTATSSVEPTTPILQLDFPRLRKDVFIPTSAIGATILMDPDCTPDHPIQIGWTIFSYPRIPTLGIKLTLMNIPPDGIPSIVQRFHIFVCTDNVLHLIQSHGSGHSRVLSWSEWGVTSTGTRWFLDEDPHAGHNHGISRMGTSGSRYVKLFCDNEERGDGEDVGSDEQGEDRVDWKDKDGLFYVTDFKPSHWRMLDQKINRENHDLICHGHWPRPAQSHRAHADTSTISEKGTGRLYGSGAHSIPRRSDKVHAIVVGSDTPTILGENDGFDELVESRLPYQLVVRRRVASQGAYWACMMSHDRIAGLQVTMPNITATVFKLRSSTQ
ncbi:unnamed protein product [Rhizoctonia solani]|uniref:F-box domain-containing protein n=1 Tax=Rhizoctonia solani TaxID=456999 RepID=A0A8H2XRI9_9AGAM|nr:unnamed protein product [Rhizoctonia solani]CAE6429637.1 unnamed protein product [Rhizoctonia solani]